MTLATGRRLTTASRVFGLPKAFWCQRPELNRRPWAYEEYTI
jgi:hypothetical protein